MLAQIIETFQKSTKMGIFLHIIDIKAQSKTYVIWTFMCCFNILFKIYLILILSIFTLYLLTNN